MRGSSVPFIRFADWRWQGMMLAAGELHVWSAALDTPEAVAMECLSEEERERAASFAFPALRSRYVAGRAIIRRLLSRYTGIAAADIAFGYGSQGKPFLNSDGDDPGLQFNFSHSAGLALFAITRAGAVGIDLEYLRPLEGVESIAHQMFSLVEYEQVMSFEKADERLYAFYSCWTRKEAFTKALGGGLSIPLDQFAVSVGDYQPRVLSISNDLRRAGCWTLYHLEPAPNYIGAVAIDGQPSAVLAMQLELASQ